MKAIYNYLKNNQRIIFYLSYVLLFIYCAARVILYFNIQSGCGDESIFIRDIEFLKKFGYIEAVKNQISIPHSLLVIPFTFIFETYLSLRIFNVILLAILIIYLIKNFKYNNYLLLIFFLFTGSSFFIGTNDGLFHLCIVLFFLELFLYLNYKRDNIKFALSILIVSVFTREMFILYFPACLILIFVAYHFKKFKIISNIFPALLIFLFFILLNVPSILTNKKLSFDDKQGDTINNNTWVERQYLSQLMANNGTIKEYSHVSWDQVTRYKRKHGINSLPKTSFEQIFFDFSLTLKEFVKDFFYMCKDSIRQMGIAQIVVFIIPLLFFKENKFISKSVIPIISLITYIIFSFIIISYVEMRWLVPISIISIIYFEHLNENYPYKHSKIIYFTNLFLINVIMIYGTFKLIPKLM